MKKRILFLRTYTPENCPRSYKELTALSDLDDFEVDFLGWDRERNDQKIVYEPLKLGNGKTINKMLVGFYAPWGAGSKKNGKNTIKFFLFVKKWLKKHWKEYDVIHACDFIMAFAAYKVIKNKNIKLVYDIFDYFPDLKQRRNIVRKALVRREQKIAKRADCTIICNEKRVEQIAQLTPKKLLVIHNSPMQSQLVSNSTFKNKSNSQKIKCVYVGNLVKDRLINLTLDVFKNRNDVELHIGGAGSLSNKVEDYSKHYDNIFYYGKMDYKDVLSLENSCDILIALYDPSIPNHKYVSPNKFYESLFLGKQLIACKGTGLDKYFEDYPIGVLIENNNDSYNVALNALIRNQDNWKQNSKIEKDVYAKNYSWEIMAERIKNLYLSLFH